MCCYSSNTGAPRPPKQGKGVNGLEEERRLALAWSSRSAPSVQVRQAGRSTCTCANRTAQRACQVRREVEFFFVTEFFFDPTVKIQFFKTATTDARGCELQRQRGQARAWRSWFVVADPVAVPEAAWREFKSPAWLAGAQLHSGVALAAAADTGSTWWRIKLSAEPQLVPICTSERQIVSVDTQFPQI